MKNETDPQETDEVSRQKAYGETLSDNARELKDQVTKAAGVRVGTDEERGFLRDNNASEVKPSDEETLETNSDRVVATSDERHPNAPDHMGADHGPKN
jgi:hypothetical protein